MSQTEDIGTQTEEATGAHADEIASLNTEQLEALIEEQDDDNAKAALQAVLDERRRIESQIAETKAAPKAKKEKAPAKSRKGSRAPKGRQVKAAESFNSNQENLDRLKRVLEGDDTVDPPVPAVIQKDADGNITGYQMTPYLVQLGISGYYDERRNEGGSAKAADPTPIIPPAADAGEGDAAVENEVAPAAAVAAGPADVVDGEDELVEPKASAGPPYNPHVDDND